MVRRTIVTLVLLACCVWCLAVVARADQAQSHAPSLVFKPAASLHALMSGQVQHFMAIGELIADPGAKGRAGRLRVEAELLAELANVNIYHRDKTDYRGWAAELRDTSLALAAEARKKPPDQDRMVSLHAKLKATCGACHDVYQ